MNQPSSGRYFELSTRHIAPRERREFWRHTMLNRSDADFRPDAATDGFSASVRGFIGDAAELRYGELASGVLRRDASRCRRDGGDEILLSAVVSSGDQVRYQDGGQEFTVPAGTFLVTDMSVPFALEMGCFNTINFRLPRAAVTRAIGARVKPRVLPATPLTTLLVEQTVRFAEAMPAMDDAARQVALDATVSFTLAALRLEARTEPWDDSEQSDGLWLASERFIERHLDHPDLGPNMLARVLRCSRTQLYRLFARHDVAVMDHIRGRRLNRCRDMLNDPACILPIAEIASLCGMDNPAAFTRGFRRRFGCTPGELRREARETRT
jgi:AraC-like DNA-binding protein